MSLWSWLLSVFFPKAAPPPTPPPAPPVPSPPGGDPAAPMLGLVNAVRSRAGMPPYARDARLERAAREQAGWLASPSGPGAWGGVLVHDGWSGRILAAGYPAAAMAEDVDPMAATAQAAVDAWVADPPHYAALVGPYRNAGFGFARAADGTAWWVMNVGA